MEVTSDSNQRFHLRLEELPGILIIDAGDLEGARVLVDGEEAGLTPLVPLELEAGEHEIRIQAHRHQELTTTVDMEGKGVEQTLEAELTPLWAGVMFKSIPAGATVKVAGKTVGVTPVIAELLAGAYRYELELAGYKRYRDTVEVEANQARTLPSVELEPADGRLVVKSEPAGAAVTVDGAYRGETPLDLPLAPGRSYTVEISRAGHEEESREVEITSGRARELKVTLAPRMGEVEIAAVPADADLFIDGEPRGRADQTLSLVALPHKIEIRKEGFKTYQGSVTPRPGLVESIQVSLTPEDPLQDPATPRILETSQGQEMVLVEGGRFRMGASRREPGRRANETLRDVELSRPFYIATTEVANRQFREFQEEHLSGQVGGVNLEIDHHPVVRVTWDQAAMYCNWLSKQDSLPPVYQIAGGLVVAQNPMGTGYRLPTEAEWAWVARMSAGGEKPVKYPWGETLPVAPRSGNFADESAGKLVHSTLDGYDDGFAATAPVDSFPPNGLGVLNMGGNVAEWVHDIYTIYPSATESFVKDPAGPEEGDLHVIRGSSWMDASVSELRLSYRDYGKKARPDVGFRIARYLE
jgi:formylglycine-generating enzyme required for sulfatase activity